MGCVWRPLLVATFYISSGYVWNRFDDLSMFRGDVTVGDNKQTGRFFEGATRLCDTLGPLECQTGLKGAAGHTDHIPGTTGHPSVGVQGLLVHVLDKCPPPHWFLFQVLGNPTVPLTTFCSLLIWFSPRRALFHSALFALCSY